MSNLFSPARGQHRDMRAERLWTGARRHPAWQAFTRALRWLAAGITRAARRLAEALRGVTADDPFADADLVDAPWCASPACPAGREIHRRADGCPSGDDPDYVGFWPEDDGDDDDPGPGPARQETRTELRADGGMAAGRKDFSAAPPPGPDPDVPLPGCSEGLSAKAPGLETMPGSRAGQGHADGTVKVPEVRPGPAPEAAPPPLRTREPSSWPDHPDVPRPGHGAQRDAATPDLGHETPGQGHQPDTLDTLIAAYAGWVPETARWQPGTLLPATPPQRGPAVLSPPRVCAGRYSRPRPARHAARLPVHRLAVVTCG